MANLSTSADCLSYMYYRIGDSQTNPNFAANALQYLIAAHRELVSGCSILIPDQVAFFPWAKSAYPKILILQPVETGTCAITQNSDTITFGSAPADSKSGYHIRFDSSTHQTAYRITAHTAATTTATLDSVVIDSTNATQSYTLFKVDYTIGSSDVLRFTDMFGSFQHSTLGDSVFKIIAEDEYSFRRYFSVPSSGYPTHYTIISESSGTFTVRFNKYLSAPTYRRLEVPYIPIPSDLDATSGTTPLVPKHHRKTLCDLALFYLFLDKNDDRAQQAFDSAGRGYAVMLEELGYKDLTFKPFRPNEKLKLGQ